EYYQKGDKFYTNEACTEELILDNHSADQWGEYMFEIENCSECGKDRGDHMIVPFNGHWFAKCLVEDGWVITDPSCNQQRYEIEEGLIYIFKEDRIINPETGETETFEATLHYDDYSWQDLVDVCAPYG